MSAPAPFTVNVPFENDALPARPTAPISCALHGAGTDPPGGGGGGGGGTAADVTETESNVEVFNTPVS